ncbi:MAG: hypothetical protein JRJ59_02425 [Deltaproteobacteria bacterium]|nr:hypothetical protein [Deltaproteobacteria bacterium]
MNWIKKGLIWKPKGDKPWSVTHATAPTFLPLGRDAARIYFTCRDADNRSHVDWIEVDTAADPWQVTAEADRPALAPGPLGCFDDRGAMTSWLVKAGGVLYFYYTGWNLGGSVPFRLSVGLALSRDGGLTFDKFSEGPLLDRNSVDPILVASPAVIRDEGGWRMWYVSGLKWEETPDGPRHYYHIRHATSADGRTWRRPGLVCIDHADQREYAISRPSVLLTGAGYKMWYSYRASVKSAGYRLGYAESEDGLSWTRLDDQVGIDLSKEGWDSEMICYAHVFKHGQRTWMLYNGNGYGRSGLGCALLDET